MRSEDVPPLDTLDLGSLPVKLAAVAVLHHSPEPMTLEALAEELQARGTRLPHGLVSVRRALASNPAPLRKRRDGRWEVDPQSSEMWYAAVRLRNSSRTPPQPQAKPAVGPLAEGLLTWAELQRAAELLQYRPVPWQKWTAQWYAAAAAEAAGGRLELGPVLRWMARLGYPEDRESLLRSLTKARRGLLRLEGEEVVLDGDMERFRRELREQLAEREAELLRAEESTESHRLRREKEARELEARRAEGARWRQGLVRLAWAGDEPFGALLTLPEGPLRLFRPGEAESLKAALAELDVVVGVLPQDDFERLELPRQGVRFVDLTPPFRTRRSARGRTLRFSLSDGLKMVTGRGLREDARLAAASPAVAERWLRGDVAVLREYHRFGALHGWVPLDVGRMRERVPVDWQPDNAPELPEILREAMRREQAVELVTLPSADPCQPYMGGQVFLPEALQRGEFWFRRAGSSRLERLALEEIRDARPAPVPAGERGAPRAALALGFVIEAMEAPPGSWERQGALRNALEFDPECLGALHLQALEQKNPDRRRRELEQCRAVGRRQSPEHPGESYQMATFALMRLHGRVGRLEEALELARELLRIDESDPLGVRYSYWEWLLECGRNEEALASLRYYDGGDAASLYAHALAEFRVHGAGAARRLAEEAEEAQPGFAALLRGEGNAWPARRAVDEETRALNERYGGLWDDEAVRALLRPDR